MSYIPTPPKQGAKIATQASAHLLAADYSGILLLDKALGLSSNHALQRAKRLCGVQKAGHTGSLDPLASGVLPLCFGEATKFSQYLLMADKSYEVIIQLGIRTSSGDAAGDVIAQRQSQQITTEDIKTALASFLPSYQQTPPMHSAIKFQGKRLYELARKGLSVPRKTREARFTKLEITAHYADILQLTVDCSKGTYIRALADDLGQRLGCGAHVMVLRRTAVGCFTIDKALTLASLDHWRQLGDKHQILSWVFPIKSLFSGIPSLAFSLKQLQRLRCGQRLGLHELQTDLCGLVSMLDQAGRWVGLGRVDADGRFVVERMLQTCCK